MSDYSRAAARSVFVFIESFSTSFSAASKLLPVPMRRDIAALYSLVRVADETVDGAAAQAGLAPYQVGERISELADEVHRAIETGFSVNPAVDPFSHVALRCGIGWDLLEPFFASMRADAAGTASTLSVDDYVYGSAEVIGLMCLKIFANHGPVTNMEEAAAGARALGRAFQWVNFLRDYREDTLILHRTYVDEAVGPLTDETKTILTDRIDTDLDTALATIHLLPAGARPAVLAAADLFAELNRILRATSAARIREGRISVPRATKARILSSAVATSMAPGIYRARRKAQHRRSEEQQ
ncbi:MAG: squalene/phytoene synthase family protein [Corynebacterium sp.]|nr:squalene/phytoene synthase family protein [Corynebacterium sp.]